MVHNTHNNNNIERDNMNIAHAISRVMHYHELALMHRNAAAQAAIKAGEHLYKLREIIMKEGHPWVAWIRENLAGMSQRNVYNYIDCYTKHMKDPVGAASCTSIRELLGTSTAGKPARILDTTKLQRALLLVADTINASSTPKLEAQALVHAIMGTEPASSALHAMVANWIYQLQLTPAIR